MVDDKNVPGGGSAAGAERVCVPGVRKDGAQVIQMDPAKSWTPEAQARFLATLAETSNIRLAAKASGFEKATAYYHRRKDPVFDEAWRDAKAQGVERVELKLIRAAERRLSGEALPVVAPDLPVTAGEQGEEVHCARCEEREEDGFVDMTIDQAIMVVKLFHGRDARGGEGGRSRKHWHWTPMDPEKAREEILRNVAAVRRARQVGDQDGEKGSEGAAEA